MVLMNLFARQQWRNRFKRTDLRMQWGGEEGEGEMYGERNMELTMLLLLLLSRFSRVQLCATPEMAAHQAPPSLRFSRQEQWSGLPFPSPTQESEK